MRWFCAEVWPEVRRRVPEVHLYIVGKQPHARGCNAWAQDRDITVTGYVPDILPYFGGADVYIVPLRVGGGTRLKVLEAMATGLAMVSTRLGAEGIDLVHGEHAMLADSPSDFAEATVRLLQDPALRRSLGARARAQAEAHYDWRADRAAPVSAVRSALAPSVSVLTVGACTDQQSASTRFRPIWSLRDIRGILSTGSGYACSGHSVRLYDLPEFFAWQAQSRSIDSVRDGIARQ